MPHQHVEPSNEIADKANDAESENNTEEQELGFPVLSKFLAQAISGVHMAMFRGLGIAFDDAARVNMKAAHLASYLNDTWKNMILRDDDYINETFDSVFETEIPWESPVCLMHVLLKVGMFMLKEPPQAGFSTSADQRTGDNAAFCNLLRNMLLEVGTHKADTLLKELLHRHPCQGVKYKDVQSEDPQEKIFTISSS